eukprot:TRINITY_DN11781_c0_g1_i1.p1 TRINITY_DN11781_c0_g1~~TRINITY_DN11781_c0_g1_i1.p1  ORF type:complete len:179 (+),score=32.21 TRINITY_DN11781_c0_g1_i1:162-698(+)
MLSCTSIDTEDDRKRSGSIRNAVALATKFSGSFPRPRFLGNSGSSDRESLSERGKSSDAERSHSRSIIDTYIDTTFEDSLSFPSSTSSLTSPASYTSSSPGRDSMATFLPASITSSRRNLAHLHLSQGGSGTIFHFQRCTDGSYRVKTAGHNYVIPRAGKLELVKEKPEVGHFYLVFH